MSIDYEQLAKAAYAERISFLQAYNTKAGTLSSRGITDAEWTARYEAIMTEGLAPIARAVVAAIEEQGLVVVRREIVEMARTGLSFQEDKQGDLIFQREIDEIDAALVSQGEQEQTG